MSKIEPVYISCDKTSKEILTVQNLHEGTFYSSEDQSLSLSMFRNKPFKKKKFYSSPFSHRAARPGPDDGVRDPGRHYLHLRQAGAGHQEGLGGRQQGQRLHLPRQDPRPELPAFYWQGRHREGAAYQYRGSRLSRLQR